MEKIGRRVVAGIEQVSNKLGLGLYVEFQPGKPEAWVKNWANGDKTGKVGWFFWAKSKRFERH